MVRTQAGWWELADNTIVAGTRYKLALDGGQAHPDPRSLYQPDGPDGWSQIVDHLEFEWTDTEWKGVETRDSVIYELHVGTFTPDSTLDSAIEKLDYLAELGITTVELMPLNQFNGDVGWGYDGVSWFAVQNTYGGPDALKRFVDAAHDRGLAVLVDVVYNHVGKRGDHLEAFGQYYDPTPTPWGPRPRFDGTNSVEARELVLDNVVSWIRDFHLDGVRVDSIHSISDPSSVHILQELTDTVRALESSQGRRVVAIAESDYDTDAVMRPADVGGLGFDAGWTPDFHKSLHVVLTGERSGYYKDFGGLGMFARVLENAYVRERSHPDWKGQVRPAREDDSQPERFVVYATNHDHVGNRAVGDRPRDVMLGQTPEAKARRAKIAMAISLLSPYTPLLWAGEEFTTSAKFPFFHGHTDDAMITEVKNGRKAEFPGLVGDAMPDPHDRATFEAAKLPWEELHVGVHAEMLSLTRDAIALRRALLDRVGPDDEVRIDRTEIHEQDRVVTTIDRLFAGHAVRIERSQVHEADGWLVAHRTDGVVMAMNLNACEQWLPADIDSNDGVLLCTDGEAAVRPGAIRVPPESLVVVGPTSAAAAASA
jgi:maltooligosyltrehalose trehalohydrolase